MSSVKDTSHSFPKTARLLKKGQFYRVTKYGFPIKGKYLALQVYETKKPSLKIGIVVSRKYGKAVRRNRFKRLVREAFRLSQRQIPPSFHLKISPYHLSSAIPSLEQIQADFLDLCRRACELCAHRREERMKLIECPISPRIDKGATS